MEYNTENIDQYLSGELSEPEVRAFEEKMKSDENFAYEVELHQTAIRVVQYPNFMREIKNVRKEIAAEDKPSTKGKKETPVVEQPKRPRTIRRLLAIAASLLLIAFAWFLIQNFQESDSPLAMTSTEIIDINGGGTKGEGDIETPLQQGIEYFNKKEYKNAITSFDQTIRENPNRRAEAQFLKADALYRMDKKPEAKAVLQSIRQSDSQQLYNKAQSILEKYK